MSVNVSQDPVLRPAKIDSPALAIERRTKRGRPVGSTGGSTAEMRGPGAGRPGFRRFSLQFTGNRSKSGNAALLLAVSVAMSACASADRDAVSAGRSANGASSYPAGFLCCNVRSDGSWISDSNYAESGKQLVPLGTPVSVTGYGRNRVNLRFADGSTQQLGNDYSRSQSLPEFAAKYVVAQDPRARMASFPQRIQTAIRGGRLVLGMTREQVLMSVGYPIADENPVLEAPYWRYWRTSFAEYRVLWDDSGRLRQVETNPETRMLIMQP